MAIDIERNALMRATQNETEYYDTHILKQPKRQLGEYVASQGIRVPRIFAGLDDALRSRKPFIVRSEHPQDLNGSSGIVDSYQISHKDIIEARSMIGVPKEIGWKKFLTGSRSLYFYPTKNQIIAQIGEVSQEKFENNLLRLQSTRIQEYAAIAGFDPAEFHSQASFSYWKAIPGSNHAIIADSAIQGRYHLFTTDPGRHSMDHQIIENNAIPHNLPSSNNVDPSSITDFYETIRNLPLFNPAECPVIEIQEDEDGNFYFLQYHLTRTVQPATFKLERERARGEIESVFVRGATGPEGKVVTATVYNSFSNAGIRQAAPQYEAAAVDYYANPLFREVMSQRRDIQIIPASAHGNIGSDIVDNHLMRSQLFKPALSVGISLKDIERIVKASTKKGSVIYLAKGEPLPQISLHVTADGKRALIRVLN